MSTTKNLYIFQRVTKRAEEDDVDGKSCALYTTQAVLASAWSESHQVSSSDLESPQTRNKLIDCLLGEAKTWQQLAALGEVLKAWHLGGSVCRSQM